ncbi:DUF4197 domain-containing protein [Elongatibacter sediminis]|uniref:DUF4197 domain-containing protein n=1 Tax=Elongatibacter sediminis TaxID=3119006 RepID=A0AAW9RCS5_9GAMM
MSFANPRSQLRRAWQAALPLAIALSIVLACAFTPAVRADIFDTLKSLTGKKDNNAASTEEIGMGLKEALTVGTERVVGQLGQPGGFNLDPLIHIPLPGQLDKVRDLLEKVGMDGLLTDLESRMNEAAEVATPKAQTLFVDAIRDLTLEDVMEIYKGPDDAATQYFRSKMSGPLAEAMTPIVDDTLADVGAVQTYDKAMDRYEDIPFASSVDMDLTGYVVDKGMDGIFYYLAREEAAIRENPAKRTTELLRKVFGG